MRMTGFWTGCIMGAAAAIVVARKRPDLFAKTMRIASEAMTAVSQKMDKEYDTLMH